MGQRYKNPDEEAEGELQEEPLYTRVKKSLKSAMGMGPKDVNLSDDGTEPERKQREFAREKADDASRDSDRFVSKLQRQGEQIRRATQGEQINEYKRKGMSEEEATRRAMSRK
jgi:hypothetical protein